MWNETITTTTTTPAGRRIDNLERAVVDLEKRLIAMEQRLQQLDPEASEGHGFEYSERMSVKWAEHAIAEQKAGRQ